MNPTWMQRWIAVDIPAKVWLSSGAVLGIGYVVVCLGDCSIASESLWNFVFFVFIAPVLGAAIGFLIAGILGAAVLPPLYAAARRRNGGPFKVGDSVRILAGAHRGRSATVYAVWDSRGQLRVDLGEEARRSVRDVVGAHQVLLLARPLGGAA